LSVGINLPAAGAETSGPSEYEIKAAFIYNFAKFTTWPGEASPDKPIVFCVAGDDPFGDVLERSLGRKTVRGRSFEFQRYALEADFRACQIVFVASEDAEDQGHLINSLKDSAALTIGDSESFVRAGGMIGFVDHKRKVRFAINRSSAENADIRISSQLLQLATVVQEGG
jgi:hypothetical protein